MRITKKEVSPSSYRALESKLSKEKEKTKQIKLELSKLRSESRILRKSLNRITKSRDKWKDKAVARGRNCNLLNNKLLKSNVCTKPKRHHYPMWLITLVVIFRIHCNCSYGSIEKVLSVLKSDDGLGIIGGDEIPCKNTMQNWVSKVGLYYIQQTDDDFFKQDLCLIIDETVRVGTEKLLVLLACPLEKVGLSDLKKEDVRVVCVEGRSTWKGTEIKDCIRKTITEKNLKVSHILSDEGNNLVKAAQLLNLPHLPDISHLIATCLKKTFKNRADFKEFSAAVGKCQAKLAMGRYCYLRPPNQRAKARFINQSKVVDWAMTIFAKWEEIDLAAQDKLELLLPQKAIVSILESCIHFAKIISKKLRDKGLNTRIIKKLIKMTEKEINKEKKGSIKSTFLNYLKSYLKQYQVFINAEVFKDKNIYTCSDIIESLFGVYKDKVSDNYFVNNTTIGLELPLLCLPKKKLAQIIQPALEVIKMSNLQNWVTKQKTDNQSTMRAKFLKK